MTPGSLFRDLSTRLRSVNTRRISREEYARHYQVFGGSFTQHPGVLDFFREVYKIETVYRGYFRGGECAGVIATWGPYIAGERYALRAFRLTDRVDFGYPILYLPIGKDQHCRVLFIGRFLLKLQQRQLRWTAFLGQKTMSILRQIPDELTTGKREFRMKERKFHNHGGTVRDVQEFGNEEIVEMYRRLFRVRWKRNPHAIDVMKDTLDHLRPFLYGKVLWVEDQAIAIQINYRAESDPLICVDYINGGVDKSFHGISPGSLLSYINGRDACAEAAAKGKQLVYSYGKTDNEYKDQWCHRVPRGYTGFWLP